MKNFFAPNGTKISLTCNERTVSFDLYSREGLDFLSNLWTKAATHHRLMYESKWLDRPIIQFPNDVIAIQELIWTVKPDIIVETGVAHGGSLVLSASILELLRKGRVIGVDIDIRAHNRVAIEAHPLSHRIDLIEGSSVAADVFQKVRDLVGDAQSILVMLDSNHSESHVLRELQLYSSLVTPGSYIVAHDGAQAWVSDIPNGKPEWLTDNPLGAIEKFLPLHPEFTVDPYWTRWGITSSPRGYLRRSGA